MRFLLIIIVVSFSVLLIRSWLAKPIDKNQAKHSNGESMVPCSQCNIHIPKSEAIYSDKHYFCNAVHQAQWLENQSN